MRANTSASQARGSIWFSLAVTIKEYIAAARSPPRSEPANNQLLAAEGYATQRSLCGVVGQADPSVIEEPAERWPTLEHVVDRLRHVRVPRHLAACTEHPGFEVDDEGSDLVLSRHVPLLVRQTIDRALEVEDCVDASHRLDRERRFCEFSQLEEVASSVCPAQSLGQRAGPSCLGIQLTEARVGIRLQDPAISSEVPVRMLTASVP